MRTEHRSEMETDGTVWTVDASVVEGRVAAEIMGVARTDGVIGLQLRIDGTQAHLAMIEQVVHDLQTALFGAASTHPPGTGRIDAIRQQLPRAYQPWSEDEEQRLLERWDAGESIALIAQALERGAGAVRSRLIRLGRIKQAG